MKDAEVLKFLAVWLTRLVDRKVVPKVTYGRALCRDRLSNTLTNIGREVLKFYQHDSIYLNLYLKIASKVRAILKFNCLNDTLAYSSKFWSPSSVQGVHQALKTLKKS